MSQTSSELGGTFPRMSHAYSRNYIHLVFATKERRSWIRNPGEMYSTMRDIADEYGVAFLEIGGTANHVHILFDLPPRIALATLVGALKRKSSKLQNEEGHLFGWQEGYGSFSVSPSNLSTVKSYILNQAEHHAKRSYEEEFTTLLNKSGMSFTPEKVFG